MLSFSSDELHSVLHLYTIATDPITVQRVNQK